MLSMVLGRQDSLGSGEKGREEGPQKDLLTESVDVGVSKRAPGKVGWEVREGSSPHSAPAEPDVGRRDNGTSRQGGGTGGISGGWKGEDLCLSWGRRGD